MNVEVQLSQTKDFMKDYLLSCGVEPQYLGYYLSRYPKKPYHYEPPNQTDKGIEWLDKALTDKAVFGIIVDSDCDGYMSATVAYRTLHNIFKIPNKRIKYFVHVGKSHGLTTNDDENIVEQVIESGVNFLIIPDAGTSEKESVEYLLSKGIRTLILDHHLPDKENFSDKGVVVNPRLTPDTSNPNVSGTCVTAQFFDAFCKYKHKRAIPSELYCDLVGISQISDSCNFANVEVFNTARYGIKNLKNNMVYAMANKFNREGVIPHSFSFGLIPIVNAVCRGDDIELKKELFECFCGLNENYNEVIDKCQKMKAHNDYLTKKMMDNLEIDNSHKCVVGFCKPENKELVGLVANKLQSKYGKPAFVLRELNENKWSGSLRSPIPLVDLINNSGLGEAHGQPSAAGCIVEKANYNAFLEWFDTLDLDSGDTDKATAEISLKDGGELCELIDKNRIMFAQGIPEPTFYLRFTAKQSEIILFRKKTTTLKIVKKDLTFIKFNVSIDEEKELESDEIEVECICTLSVNEYNGEFTPQATIQKMELRGKKPQEVKWEDVF